MASHRDWLERHIMPLLHGQGQYTVEVRGLASRLGSSTFNEQLGQKRADRVKAFLEAAVHRSLDNVRTVTYGESVSTGAPRDNDGYFRAVLVAFHKGPALKPPPTLPAPTAVSDLFKLRLLGEVAASRAVRKLKLLKAKLGIGPGVDVMFFQIVDLKNDLTAFYVYAGGNVGAGLTSVTATLKGPWNVFVTSSPIGVTWFEGFTRFSTIGGGCSTINVLHMCGTPSGVKCVYENIDTGCTVGGGVSLGLGGKMTLLEGPLPWKAE